MYTVFRRPAWLSILLIALLAMMMTPVHAQDGGRRVDQGVAFFQANGIPPEAFRELSATVGTSPQRAAEVLVKYGYTPEQAQAFMTPQNVLTMRAVLNPGPSNEVIGQAMGLLAPYNLTINDLSALFPNLNNPQAMAATLVQKGLTMEQASQLLTQAAPIIQQANEGGLLQYAVLNDQIAGMMNQAGFDYMLMYNVGNVINDPEAIAAKMKEQGYTEAQIQSFQTLAVGMTAQGITPELIDGWTVKNMVYRLEGIGLDPTTINEIVALGSRDAVQEYLEGLGYSGETLELALVNLAGCLGENGEVLDPERLQAYQAGEAARLLDEAGIDPENLGDILSLMDDPDAMRAYLEDSGLSDEQIAAFEKGLA
ncbi:MAG: hypothetical protein IT323_20550, partial [Anaerolineae bacterium]|nr:hypothetical protein [Anaerolineae bacterium]